MQDRPAFDVNAAWSGFIYAAAAAHGLLSTLGGRYALVIGCEALSRMVDPTDRTTCVLFGDGAGAAIFELAENAPFAVTLGARGSEAIRAGGPAARDTAPITMDGKAVFRFAVEAMPRCLQAVLDRSQKTSPSQAASRPAPPKGEPAQHPGKHQLTVTRHCPVKLFRLRTGCCYN